MERNASTSPYKEALLRKRGEILAAGGGAKPIQQAADNNSRQGDLADQASGNNEVHIQLKLKQIDAKILQAIEEALVAAWRRAPTASAATAASRSPRPG